MATRLITGAAALTLSATATLFAPSLALACGGFFCSSVPIDQSGENIVYAMEADGSITTHVQILYQGQAEDFAWILPVPAEPEVSVGTDRLFAGLDAATAPRFVIDDYRTEGTCRTEPTCRYPDPTFPGPGGGWDASAGGADSATDAAGGVEVHFEGAVGPYDVATLTAGDVQALHDWLTSNNYDIPPESIPLLEDYVTKGDHFVALKLQQDRGVGEIQPVVLRFQEEKPCLPIRLTSIAATPDMPITAYVLGAERAVPLNYMRVNLDLNDVRLWGAGAVGLDPRTMYSTLVGQAIDDAGGQGFVTEYSGTVPTNVINVPDLEQLRTARSPTEALQTLRFSDLNQDPLLLPILMRHIPVPETYGEDSRGFYNCLASNFMGNCGEDVDNFDINALADAIDTQILVPRREANEMLGRHAKLTRLFTTMNPEEMTVDPLFDTVAGLADVSNVHGATQVTECSSDYFQWEAPRSLILPNGDRVQTFAGRRNTQSDAAYCNQMGGSLGPLVGSPGSIGDTRPTCSVQPGVTGAGGVLGFLSLIPLALFARRRLRRR